MLIKELEEQIKDWTSWANQTNSYDIALFKIWISFERFLGDSFVSYCLGMPSESGFIPKLKVEFKDEEILNVFIREKNKNYIDYIPAIERFHDYIFEENVFGDAIFFNSENKSICDEIKTIRNYVAHESRESKDQYIKHCLSNKEFIGVNEYLKKSPKKKKQSHYSIYIDAIINMACIVSRVSKTV